MTDTFPHLLGKDGHFYGPYASEGAALKYAAPGETVHWLTEAESARLAATGEDFGYLA